MNACPVHSPVYNAKTTSIVAYVIKVGYSKTEFANKFSVKINNLP